MICGTVYLLPQFMGGQDSAEPTVNDNSGNDVLQNNSPNIVIGSLVIAEGIDRDGCAVNNVSSLQSANRFYVIAPNSAFPSGTTIFARLYQDGLAIEDLPLITANQDYSGSCISFVFETVNGNNFGIGQYEAEFWVNGNAYNSIRFNVA
jgi:hypothetical protein